MFLGGLREYYIQKWLKNLKKNSLVLGGLKVPKREIFVTELFTLSDPIWISDMRTE